MIEDALQGADGLRGGIDPFQNSYIAFADPLFMKQLWLFWGAPPIGGVISALL